VHKDAGLWMCLFALTSSLKSAFLFLSFPGFREEPFFCLAALCGVLVGPLLTDAAWSAVADGGSVPL